MKAAIFTRGILSRRVFAIPVAIAAICAVPAASHGQIFVANNSSGTIGEYAMDGTTINASLISGLNGPVGLAISGSNLYVADDNSNLAGTLREFTTSGTTVNSSLVTASYLSGVAASGSDFFATTYLHNYSSGNPISVWEYTSSGTVENDWNASENYLGEPTYVYGIAVSDSDVFVTLSGYGPGSGGRVEEYTTAGVPVDTTLFSGLDEPTSIAVSGSDIFVLNSGSGTIGEYTTSGATVNASLITGLPVIQQFFYPYDVEGLAISGSDILVGNNGSISEYTTDGTLVNPNFIPGAEGAIVVVDAPEPASLSLLLLGSVPLLNRRRRIG